MNDAAPASSELLRKAFWQSLCPDLHIGSTEYWKRNGAFSIGAGQLAELKALMDREGYFEFTPHQWGPSIDALARAVSTLARAGISPTFVFVYDEFWTLFRQLDSVLEAALGPGFLRMPNFWVWHVDPQRGESGWPPHRDRDRQSLFPDRSPKALSAWVALTESTPLNGCIYVVPADRDPTFGTEAEHDHQYALADVRALPVSAGTVICWNQALIHWGSRTSPRAAQPRISVALEFQSGAAEPLEDGVMPPDLFPSFAQRILMIAQQLLRYQRRHKSAADVALAKQILMLK